MGDGVLCVEFHSKLNTLGEDNVAMVYAGLEETNRNFEAMIIANEGETFSAGANLMLVLLAAQEGEWEELNFAVQRFQQMNMALKYAAKPVVAAPFSRAPWAAAANWCCIVRARRLRRKRISDWWKWRWA